MSNFNYPPTPSFGAVPSFLPAASKSSGPGNRTTSRKPNKRSKPENTSVPMQKAHVTSHNHNTHNIQESDRESIPEEGEISESPNGPTTTTLPAIPALNQIPQTFDPSGHLGFPFPWPMVPNDAFHPDPMISNFSGLPHFPPNGFSNILPPLPFAPSTFTPGLDLYAAQATNGTSHFDPTDSQSFVRLPSEVTASKSALIPAPMRKEDIAIMRKSAQSAVIYLHLSQKLTFEEIISQGIDKTILKDVFERLRLPYKASDEMAEEKIEVVGKEPEQAMLAQSSPVSSSLSTIKSQTKHGSLPPKPVVNLWSFQKSQTIPNGTNIHAPITTRTIETLASPVNTLVVDHIKTSSPTSEVKLGVSSSPNSEKRALSHDLARTHIPLDLSFQPKATLGVPKLLPKKAVNLETTVGNEPSTPSSSLTSTSPKGTTIPGLQSLATTLSQQTSKLKQFDAPQTASSRMQDVQDNSGAEISQPLPIAKISNSRSRKRPVAADFDSELSQSTIKRKFGDLKEMLRGKVVIDVSEGEEDDHDEHSNAERRSIKSIPSASASPKVLDRLIITTTAQASSPTPPHLSTPSERTISQTLQNTEEQIRLFRLKIEEKMMKKKLLATTSTTPSDGSRAMTPIPITDLETLKPENCALEDFENTHPVVQVVPEAVLKKIQIKQSTLGSKESSETVNTLSITLGESKDGLNASIEDITDRVQNLGRPDTDSIIPENAEQQDTNDTLIKQGEDAQLLLGKLDHTEGGRIFSDNVDKVMTPPFKLPRVDPALSSTVLNHKESSQSDDIHCNTPQATMTAPVSRSGVDYNKSSAMAKMIPNASNSILQDLIPMSYALDTTFDTHNTDLMMTSPNIEMPKSPVAKKLELMMSQSSIQNMATSGLSVLRTNFVPYESVISKFSSSQRRKNTQQTTNPYGQGDVNLVDHEKPLCLWETQGGTCNDENCTWQHFVDLPRQ